MCANLGDIHIPNPGFWMSVDTCKPAEFTHDPRYTYPGRDSGGKAREGPDLPNFHKTIFAVSTKLWTRSEVLCSLRVGQQLAVSLVLEIYRGLLSLKNTLVGRLLPCFLSTGDTPASLPSRLPSTPTVVTSLASV